MNWIVTQGDARRMPLAENTVDAIITDPPYGLEFMGKDWDKLARPKPGNLGGFATGDKPSFERVRTHLPQMQAWHCEWLLEALRVLRPGGHLLAFGGTRTFHRLACAIEDTGFGVRDCLTWLYGSGFPKSKNIGGGWGTALKPAWEPIILARKPLSEANVAANVKRWGVGAVNVDGCRISGFVPKTTQGASSRIYGGGNGLCPNGLQESQPHDAGRWPANVILDDEAAAALDQQTGELKAGGDHTGDEPSRPFNNCYGEMNGRRVFDGYGDAGGASRFFYCAKASRAERNAGCDGLPLRQSGMVSNTSGQHVTRRDGGAPLPAANHHPTVKPIALMRYLCRLVTPPKGLVLDCFLGSGSTGVAALAEGFRFIGFEREAEYLQIARARITAAPRHEPGLFDTTEAA